MTRSAWPGLAVALAFLAAGLIVAFTVGRYPVSVSDLIDVLFRGSLAAQQPCRPPSLT
jgi:hypothetical protein